MLVTSLTTHKHWMMNFPSLLLVALAIVGLIPMASAGDFRLVPKMMFEHRFYENGDEDFFVSRDGIELNYRPSVRILSVGGHLIDLSGSIYESLDDGDFAEAIFFQSENDKDHFCVEFGFGGLLRSGSFQKTRGKLSFHLSVTTSASVQYIKGPDVRCDGSDGTAQVQR